MATKPTARPVLLVEGHGDHAAVPELVRRVAQHLELYGVQPASHPIRCGSIPKLGRDGQLERFVTYALSRRDGDSALLVLDCDDDCAVEVARDFAKRAAPIVKRFDKALGIAFLVREFETLFLGSVPMLSERHPDLGWNLKAAAELANVETIRGAEERLRKLMKVSRYKKTRDQARFVHALDLERLGHLRCYRHLEATIRWLALNARGVYPSH